MLGLFQVCCILTVFNGNVAWPSMVVITVVGLTHTGLARFGVILRRITLILLLVVCAE